MNKKSKGMNDEIERENTPMIAHYKKLGFLEAFEFEGGKLLHTPSGKGYEPEDIHIYEEHKLKQKEKPSDLSILIVFKTGDDKKGIFLMDPESTHNRLLKDFFRNIPDRNYIKNEEAKPPRP